MSLARLLLLCSAALSTACATESRVRLGDINLRPYGSLTASISTFSVQEGRILSPDLDLSVQPDGCIDGMMRHNQPLHMCKTKEAPEPERDGAEKVEHWHGLGADFVVELEDHGQRMRADGFLSPSGQLSRALTIQATLPLGTGRVWDELRKYPALLAVAAAVAGVSGEPDTDALRFAR